MLSQEDYAALIDSAPILCVDLILKTASGKILLFRRNNEPLKGRWWVPGGRIEKLETALDAARRKAREETGIEIEEARFIGFYEMTFDRSSLGIGPYHTVSLVFEAFVNGTPDVRLDSQHDEWRLSEELPAEFIIKAAGQEGSPVTKDERGNLTFACSGRKLYMARPQIGIDPDCLTPVCGCDDAPRIEGRPHPLCMDPDESSYDLTPEERRELADYAIALWERYAKEGPKPE